MNPPANFEDHFSAAAKTYAAFRPTYPAELYNYLAGVAPDRLLAWDCGTGNGQAAVALAVHFQRVVATDASHEQIEHAAAHDRVEYRVEPAEKVSLKSGSVSLVTVAVAVHWFDFEAFYAEVKRVLRPGGVLAVWTYHLPSVTPSVDPILYNYFADILSGYWPERIRYLDERYRTLPFPFNEISAPELSMVSGWNLNRLAGFLHSWSATRRYIDENGSHPVELIWKELETVWGPAELERTITWPLHMRIGLSDGAMHS